ncbi:MAG: TolC family protein [Acidobacteria bacterium]|nr:TolC family protein [Acidobacteriota bacterium]
MRTRALLGAFLPVFLAGQSAPSNPSTPPLAQLPAFATLMEGARGRNPQLQRSGHLLEASAARVTAVGALPDPEVSFGFLRRAAMDVTVESPGMTPGNPPDLLMGVLPRGTEFSIMGSQVIPWPGKRRLREEAARAGLGKVEAERDRVRLDLEGAVMEALLGWLRLRGEFRLLEEQDGLWAQAESIAKLCCEEGTGSQADLLQAMMERTRLKQRRLQLDNQEATLLAGLRTLGALDDGQGLQVEGDLDALPRPGRPEEAAAVAEALARSPEWNAAHSEIAMAAGALGLGRMDLRPDIRLTAGLMREPGMGLGWKAEVGFALPVFAGRKQQQVVTQRLAEHRAAGSGRTALRLELTQRVQERLREWTLADRQLRLYEDALLPQGELSIRSLMGTYEAGRTPFGSLLEALKARLQDRQAHLDLLARLHSLSIAHYRVSLEPSGEGAPAAGMASMARPNQARASRGPSSAAPAPDAPASTPMKM